LSRAVYLVNQAPSIDKHNNSLAIYACETWDTTKTDEQNLARFERKVLRRIFGPRRNQNTGEYERRKNKEVISMLEDPDIIATI